MGSKRYRFTNLYSTPIYNKPRNLNVVFLNTDPDTAAIVQDMATSSKQYYVDDKWVGGTLTNWTCVRKSIKAYGAFVYKWSPLLQKSKHKITFPQLEKKKTLSGYFSSKEFDISTRPYQQDRDSKSNSNSNSGAKKKPTLVKGQKKKKKPTLRQRSSLGLQSI